MPDLHHWDALDTAAFNRWLDDRPDLLAMQDAIDDAPKYETGRANYEPAMTPQREAQLLAEVGRLRLEVTRLEFRNGELRAEVERRCIWCRLWERLMGGVGC